MERDVIVNTSVEDIRTSLGCSFNKKEDIPYLKRSLE
jgi:hypothetical protein